MKKWGIIGAVIAAILIIVPISAYNGILNSHETVLEKSAVIDIQLKRRADLIGNLVESVKGYAAHETEIINTVSDARAKLSGAETTNEKVTANAAASGALSRLIAISENYPDLKADVNFRQLSDELTGTENRIAVARIAYNTAVRAYNNKIITFPSNIIADSMGMEKSDYFEASEGDKEVPKIDFGKQ